MRTLILGAGPAGLFAAHAAALAGHDIIIMSKPRKSFMKGAQYLHRPIPGLSPEDSMFEVEYLLQGTVEGYRKKIYGNNRRVKVSPEKFLGKHNAWDIRVAYDAAWAAYESSIYPLELLGTPGELEDLTRWAKPDNMISTVPAPLLCRNQSHFFVTEMIWATDTVMGLGRDNVVVCSGDPEDPWYRKSLIHGWGNTEYPHKIKPIAEEDHLWEVEKPVQTNCDCLPEILRVGRYGSWTKDTLSDGAFYSIHEQFHNGVQVALW